MRERKVNRTPILDEKGAVIAILARDDIVEAVARSIRRIRRQDHDNGSVLTPI